MSAGSNVSTMPPFLQPVQESRLRLLKQRLESISKLSVDFVVLLCGSTLIATLGLFQNSPAVIIGAMIIAPLMRPLVGLSLATLTGDGRLLARALLTLVVGTASGMGIACLMALLFRSLELTPEIFARTHPTLLDLGVAIFAGAVGAYCQADEQLSESLAGVAIAVALVPPLSVVGIGLAFGNLAVSSGAALLYATNLIGITISGALVFLFLGFTPLHQAKKGLLISAGVSALLIIPLALSMRELILENQISASIRRILQEKTFTFKTIQLHDVRVERFKQPMVVRAMVLAPEQPITPRQVALVQDFLTHELGMPLEFRLQIIPVTEISATGTSPERATTASPTAGAMPDESLQPQSNPTGAPQRSDMQTSPVKVEEPPQSPESTLQNLPKPERRSTDRIPADAGTPQPRDDGQ